MTLRDAVHKRILYRSQSCQDLVFELDFRLTFHGRCPEIDRRVKEFRQEPKDLGEVSRGGTEEVLERELEGTLVGTEELEDVFGVTFLCSFRTNFSRVFRRADEGRTGDSPAGGHEKLTGGSSASSSWTSRGDSSES